MSHFLVQVPCSGMLTLEFTKHHAEAVRVFEDSQAHGTLLIAVDSIGRQKVLQEKRVGSGLSVAEMNNIKQRAAMLRKQAKGE